MDKGKGTRLGCKSGYAIDTCLFNGSAEEGEVRERIGVGAAMSVGSEVEFESVWVWVGVGV